MARGVHHVKIEYFNDGGSQATDSLTTFRYEGNAHGKVDRAVMGSAVFTRSYDDHGHLVAFADALGATWRGTLGQKPLDGVHFQQGDEIRIEGKRSNVILDGEIFEAKNGRPIEAEAWR